MNLAKRRKRLFAGLALAAVTLAGGVVAWRSHQVAAQERSFYNRAAALIAQGAGDEALQIITGRNHSAKTQTLATRDKWLMLEIAALGQTGQESRLLALYERSPAMFVEQEAASLLVARALLQAGNLAAVEMLRGTWKER